MYGKGNMAFKYNYCNGKDKKSDFGFKRICDEECIKNNIEIRKASWCSHEENACRRFYDKHITYDELERIWQKEGVCEESVLLNFWKASAQYTTKYSKMVGRTIRNAKVGGVCVLTSVKPGMSEAERKIFGVFMIDEIYEGNQNQCGEVRAHERYRLDLTEAEADQLNFWDFYRNENTDKARWGQGIFRYLYDMVAAQMLKELVKIKDGSKEAKIAEEMLERFCRDKEIDINEITEPAGANK